MNNSDINALLSNHPDLRDGLYARGYLFTNIGHELMPTENLGKWNFTGFADGFLMFDPRVKYTTVGDSENEQVLLGHAYNPFTMEADEKKILESLSDKEGSAFYNVFNQLTGIFTYFRYKNGVFTVIGDPTCMQTNFYYADGGKVAISSHTNLLNEVLHLDWDPYVRHLVSYKLFKLLGNSLPGDLTQFKNVRRMVPNFEYRFDKDGVSISRFFCPHKEQVTVDKIVDGASDILHKNLQLIAEKWDKPAISMTGGCDSKTTLSCANGLYDKYSYFSYRSSEAEQVDADAAKVICNALGLTHKTYVIPENDAEVSDVAETGKLLRWNTGDIRNSNSNDIRKRAFFKKTFDYDVEVKSWASEIGRAYYSKRFNGRTNFGSAPTPRKMTTCYKFFFHDRKLVKQTDAVFAEYAKQFFQSDKEHPIEWQDQFFWEFRVPSWNGLVITGEHRYSFDITIPYNNRLLLNLLLSAPIESRISDEVYKRIRTKMNPAIDQTGIAVTNLKHTEKREKLENIYYAIHSKIPF